MSALVGVKLLCGASLSGLRTIAVTWGARNKLSRKIAEPTNPVAPIRAIFTTAPRPRVSDVSDLSITSERLSWSEPSLRQTNLLHEILVIPHEGFLDHLSILPMTDSNHRDFERFSSWLYGLTISHWHRLSESAGHDASHACPFNRSELNRMGNDFSVWCKNELRFEFVNMGLDTFSLMPSFIHARAGTATHSVMGASYDLIEGVADCAL